MFIRFARVLLSDITNASHYWIKCISGHMARELESRAFSSETLLAGVSMAESSAGVPAVEKSVEEVQEELAQLQASNWLLLMGCGVSCDIPISYEHCLFIIGVVYVQTNLSYLCAFSCCAFPVFGMMSFLINAFPKVVDILNGDYFWS